MELLQCVRCQKTWYQRKPERPKRCAGCKVLHWDIPKRIPKVRALGPVGAPIKYPIQNIEVGKTVILPWLYLPNGQLDSKRILSMHSAISSYGRRSGKKFAHFEGITGVGLKVTRLK